LVVVGGMEKGIECYNLDTGNSVRAFLNGHAGSIETIAFLGKTMITSGSDNRILLWNLY
jgi:WD40 repeat protein